MLTKLTETEVRTCGPHSTVQNAVLWRNLRKTLMNILFPQNSGNFKASSVNISSPTDSAELTAVVQYRSSHYLLTRNHNSCYRRLALEEKGRYIE
jgi:hypothetical protein